MRPHPIDPFSLVVGVAFVALGIAGFAGGVDLDRIESGALIPIALLTIAIAIASSLRTTRPVAPQPTDWPEPDDSPEPIDTEPR
jgi:hypothetical protein